ncbi:MAG: 2-thiouracil desulfurase family protein, partial [Ignisphaera sp.]
MARPRIMLSECLGVKSVRYDGNIVFDSFIEILKKYVDVVPICPEVGIGLGIPRNPLVLRKENNNIELIDTGTGSIYTKLLEKFAIDV